MQRMLALKPDNEHTLPFRDANKSVAANPDGP